jgi:hypothetical protein
MQAPLPDRVDQLTKQSRQAGVDEHVAGDPMCQTTSTRCRGSTGRSHLRHQYHATSTHGRPMETGNGERPRYATDRRSSFQRRFGTQSDLIEKAYLAPMRRRQFTVEEGILYYFEYSKATRVRQLPLRVVPPRLRRFVVAACHVSPFAGHRGETTTF